MDGGDNDRYVALKDTSEIHPFDTMTSFCGNKRQYSENQVFQEVKKPTTSNVNNKSTNNNIYSKTSPQCTLLCSCKTALAYPQGALSVVCPVCNSTNKVMQYLRCGSCSTVLQFQAGAQYVKCVCKSLNTNPYFGK